jgi:ubiquinone/menaquinone biosynthesis C-methylase UbiE
MRVLDVGCGSGDVALIARDLFGEAVGIDREEALLETARPACWPEGTAAPRN